MWAVRILEGQHEAFRFLADDPCAGEQREDLRPGLRVFPGGGAARQFLVFYYPLKNGIEVNTVIHGSRDYLGMLERGEWKPRFEPVTSQYPTWPHPENEWSDEEVAAR